ncbi:MAG: hypothetical protein H7325_09035 [Pedobacter sp.]|nr:hypothetical protein [Pedobacter sp.]
MKTKIKEKPVPTLENRKLFGRLDEATKSKILKEINDGLIGQRQASKKYNIPRTTIILWQRKVNYRTLLVANDGQNMIEKQGSKFLLDKIQSLTKALEQAQLKNVMLETMIEVAESELSIKIRKKRGTKQSLK